MRVASGGGWVLLPIGLGEEGCVLIDMSLNGRRLTSTLQDTGLTGIPVPALWRYSVQLLTPCLDTPGHRFPSMLYGTRGPTQSLQSRCHHP